MSFALRRPGATAEAPAPAVLEDVQGEAREVEAAPTGPYVGLVTRVLAWGVDAAIVTAVGTVTAAIVALTFSILKLPHEIEKIAAVLGGVIFVVWNIGYFVTFWSTTGQTPGNRLMRIRVRAVGGERLKPRRAALRFAGVILAAIPLGAGFLLILVDNRRRGLQDHLARTVVVEAPDADDEEGASRPRPASRPASR